MKPPKSWETFDCFGKHAWLPQGQETHEEMFCFRRNIKCCNGSRRKWSGGAAASFALNYFGSHSGDLQAPPSWKWFIMKPLRCLSLSAGHRIIRLGQRSASAAPRVWVCWVMVLCHTRALFSISFYCFFRNLYFLCFCHTSWRRWRKAWNQASSATLGNFIKTECLFCSWILCLAAAAHLCWESCSEKQEFCLPELTTPNSNNFPCWGHSGCGRPELKRINGRERLSVTLNLLVFVCS